jgi:hypothetical protein
VIKQLAFLSGYLSSSSLNKEAMYENARVMTPDDEAKEVIDLLGFKQTLERWKKRGISNAKVIH